MNHKFLFSLSTLGLLTGLTPLNAYAQTFYQCMPCEAGTRNVNGKCEACPAGTYNTSTGSSSCVDCGYGTYASTTGNTSCSQCSPGYYADYRGAKSCTACPAGTYNNKYGATSSADCTPCPDYQWSNKGSSKCGTIQIPSYYFAGTDNTKYKKKILYAGETYTFTNDMYGVDPKYKEVKSVGLGQKSMTYYMENWTLFLDCKKLPCENLPDGHNGRSQRILLDGTIQFRFTDLGYDWSNGEKVTW